MLSGLDSDRLRKAVSWVLPGYCVPELYAVERPFSRAEKSQIDFAAIEEIIRAEISANLLLTDPDMIYC